MDTTVDKPKTMPKDFFLYLGVAVSLYASAGALLALLFNIINIALPDLLNPYYSAMWAVSGMQFAISVLIVAFPIFIILSWLIRKDISRDKNKYQLLVRKWFIYFTLFLAGVVLAGDLVALVHTYLGGEITARFIWKMVSVFAVASAIFSYYFYDVRRASSGDTRVNRTIMIVAVVGVVVSIIAGIVLVGSPSEIRSRRFDESRVNDLQNILWSVTDYYQLHGKLPETLDALQDDIAMYKAPVDPETQESYEYTIKNASSLTFEVCAVFSLQSTDENNNSLMYPEMQMFKHGVGRTCFERSIDPKQYPIKTQ
jgi:hypothetical protein